MKMNTKSILLFVMLSFLLGINANAQLLGGTSYTINGTSNPPSSFATVAESFAYLNTNGTSGTGTVLLEIATGYVGEIGAIPALNTYPGMDASRPIVLKPASGFSTTIRTSPVASAGVIRLVGVKYFTIDGSNNGTTSRDLTIKFQSNLTLTSAVIVINPSATITSDNITIKNCNIVGFSTNTSCPTAYGIYLGGTTVPSVPSIGQNDSNSFENNYIQAVNFGIYLRGLATGNRDNLNRVTGNLIGGTIAPNGPATDSMTFVGFATANAAGVWFTGQNNILIDSNQIRNHVSNTAYGFSGIFATTTGQFNTNVTISRNRIHDLTYLGTGGWGEYGMRLNLGISTLQNYDIFNNQIWNIRTDGFSTQASTFNPNGIMLEGTSANANVNFYYNSINLSGTTLNAGASSALWIGSGLTGGIRAVNNIFSNTFGGVATAACHAVTINSTTAMPLVASNHNIYFANSATSINRLGWMRGAAVLTQAAFVSATTGTGLDANSIFANPNYVSNTDLTINGLPGMAGGTPIVTPTFSRNITADIRNFTRDISTPSIGSYEVQLSPMAFDSTTASQITTAIIAGNTNQAVLRIKVSVTGGLNPLNVSKLSFTTTGSTNPLTDIDSAKVFYTAGNQVFSPINQFGANVLNPNSLFQISGSRNLQIGDNYFWLVYDVKSSATLNNLLDATFDSITISNTNYLPIVSNPAGARQILGAMAGNYNVGSGQVYSTITNALLDLNVRGVSAAVTFTLTDATYNAASGEVFPIVLAPYTNASAVNTVTIRPATGNTAEIINAAASPVFSFNGGRFYRIDGRQNSSSNPKSLTVRSDNTGGNAVLFVNDASDNIIRHSILLGNNTTPAAGVVNFSTGLITGNDNNTIDSSSLGNSASIPVTIINAAGSTTNATILNSNNTISNNEIYNFWNAAGESNAFKISNGNTDWTITGNHIYQTSPKVAITGLQNYIWNLNKGANANALNNMIITNNIIGGSQPNAGGAPYTVSGTVAVRFTGAYLDMGTLTPSLFQNNTFTNFNWTTNDISTIIPGTWNAIWNVNGITSILNNTIGSMSANDAIVITGNANGGVSFPIGATGTTAGLINISGNMIGGIRTQSSSIANGVSLIAIAATGSTTTYNINNNTIGGALPASIHISNPTIATAQTFAGIQYGSSVASTISNNIIRNIRNSYAGTAGGGITGIQNNNGGALTITGNRIFNCYGTANNPGTVIFGIRITTVTAGQTISGNTIYNLVMDSANAVASNISGIWYTGTTTGTNLISGNFIHSFNHLSNNRAASFTGINIQSGNSQIVNNMIRLGYDSAGTVVTNGYAISGISEIAGTNDYFHNSVYIGGVGVIDSSNTAAFVSTSTSTSNRNIRNNIFVNERSNTGTIAKNYAVRFANSTNLIANNNIYRANGLGAVYGSLGLIDYPTFGSWKTTGFDGSSTSADPNFVNKNGAASLVDLHVQSPTPVEANGFAIASVTTDFDGQLRSSLTATDIGADAGNFVGIDVIPPSITYTNLVNTGVATSRILTATISDVSGVFVSGVNRPRIYYKKMVSGTYFSSPGVLTSGNSFNGTWNFTIDPINVGGLIAGDSLYYYVIAQDSSINSNIASNPGGVEATDVNSIISHPVINSAYTILIPYSGTYSVGAGQTFATLTGVGGAFQALNNGSISGNVTLELTSDIEEPGTIALNEMPKDNINFIIKIVPDAATLRSLTGSFSTSNSALIRLDGADKVIIDGRFNGAGRFIRIMNRIQGAATLNLLNDAQRDTIRNVIIEGVNNTIGMLNFFGSNVPNATGNDSNAIVGCMFRDTLGTIATSNIPNTAIFSQGTPENNFNTISDNEIYNFGFNGINLSATSGSFWRITNNSFYQTITKNNAMTVIQINGGNGHTISGNSFGGSSANRSGSAFVSSGSLTMIGLATTLSTTNPIIIDSNTFSNISSTGTTNFMKCIVVGSGNVQITNNIFGGAAMPYDTLRNSGDAGVIELANATTLVSGNVISDFRYYQGSTVYRHTAIYATNGTHTITNNIIRRIEGNNATTSFGLYTLNGIHITGGTNHIVRSNQISEIRNFNFGTAAYPVVGIHITGSTNLTVERNKVSKIFALGLGVGASSPQIVGMYCTTTLGVNFINNQISVGAETTGESRVFGFLNASTSGNCNYFYNSVFINGLVTSGINTSYAINRTSSANVVAMNNIFYNKRGSLGTGKQYPIGSSLAINNTNLNYNLLVGADTASIAELGGLAQSWTGLNTLYATTYQTNWAESFANIPAEQFFTDTAINDLSIVTSSPLAWYANGKGLRIANISGDINNQTSVRTTSISNGATDIGSVEFNPTSIPVTAWIDKVPALGDSSNFFFASRRIAKVNWGSTGTVPSSVDLKFYSGMNPSNTPSGTTFMNAYWDFQSVGGTGLNVRVELLQDSSMLGTVVSPANLRLARYSGTGTTWSNFASTTVNTVQGNFAANSISLNSLGIFTGTNANSNPLPVELRNFNAIATENNVDLFWSTSSEINNAGFALEYSVDGKEFTEFDFVKGMGTSNKLKKYSSVHLNAFDLNNKIYYRLKQVDYSGEFEYSNIIAVSKDDESMATISFYPNPVTDKASVSYLSNENASLSITVFDINGTELFKQNVNVKKGESEININEVQNLSNGVYMIRIDDSLNVKTIKFIKSN